jgi:hypothetical protein
MRGQQQCGLKKPLASPACTCFKRVKPKDFKRFFGIIVGLDEHVKTNPIGFRF